MDALTGSPVLGASPACVDTPLLGSVSERITSTLRFGTPAVATLPVAEILHRVVIEGRVVWMRESRPTSARILRSVVLLI